VHPFQVLLKSKQILQLQRNTQFTRFHEQNQFEFEFPIQLETTEAKTGVKVAAAVAFEPEIEA
jgi:hypothetical protein